MATRMQQRRGTATQWSGSNPILAPGEIGFESDTNKFKIGDGVNHWADLTYFTDAESAMSSITDLIDGAPDLLNTLNELAASIGDNPDFIGTMTTNLAAKAPINSPTFTGTVSGVTKAMVGLGSVDNTADASKPVSTAQATAIATAKSEAISTAAADATTKANNAKSGAETTAATALASHEADTTNIHGIADTSALATKTYADNAASTAVAAVVNSAPEALNTLKELADALTADESTAATLATLVGTKASSTDLSNHESDTTNIHGITDTAELATKAFAANLLVNATKSNITITGNKDGLTITAENGVADSTTDNLTEGSTNKYFTDERAQDAIGNNLGSGLSYDDGTGAISVNTTTIQTRVSGVSDTEIGYLDGVTSSIQTQLDSKLNSSDIIDGGGA